MANELWLARHGETAWSLSGQHTSRTDLELTPNGERQAAQLGALLRGRKFSLILSSPMKRAVKTAHLAGFEPRIDEDLREWDYGEYEGLTTAQIHAIDPGWSIWMKTPKGGESAAQITARADGVIARAESASGDVLMFGHGHMLRVLVSRWIALEAAAGCHFALATGSLSVLGRERDNRVIRQWNRNGNLNGPAGSR